VSDDDFSAWRDAMVDAQIAGRGVRDRALLEAMRSVPREAFVATGLRERAYDDTPLSIGSGQTISQPYIVALMLEAAAIAPRDRVLEVGAGSGYAAAIAGRLAAHVDAVERHAGLARAAAERLASLGFGNVAIHQADGSVGWPAGAPYDAIVVSAAGPHLPAALREQLAVGGRLVMPVGDRGWGQRLLKLTRIDAGNFRQEDLGGVVFVPLVGAQGWAPDDGES
jgi:protein-L-isoaspartate(D-aspartate) O-methyltransferase